MALPTQDPLSLLHKMQLASRTNAPGLPEQVQTVVLWSGLGFRIADLALVAPLNQVSEVLPCPAITLVPGTRRWVKGIANVRGNLFTVIDLPEYFGMDPVAMSERARLLIMNAANLNAALLVNEVLGLRHFDEEQERADVSGLDGPVFAHVRGAFQRDDILWGIFDMQSLAASEAFINVAA
ncbi:MAG: chemotaxis protein CheW [Gammaproteobacteria bacterium]|nr:chemotaxis protein CheW [Gammaproteobacteria bacterium]